MTDHHFRPESREPASTDLVDAPLPDIDQIARNTSKKLLFLLVAGAALFLAINLTPLGEQFRHLDTLAEQFKSGGIKAAFHFVLISSLLMTAGAPRLLFWGAAGFIFDFWLGLFCAQCSSLIASFLMFQAARWGGRAWFSERFGKARFFARIVNTQPSVASVVLIRMLPLNNGIINVGLALSRVNVLTYLLGSLIGFLPQGVVALVIGSGITNEVPWAGVAQISVVVVLVLFIFFRASMFRRKKDATPSP